MVAYYDAMRQFIFITEYCTHVECVCVAVAISIAVRAINRYAARFSEPLYTIEVLRAMCLVCTALDGANRALSKPNNIQSNIRIWYGSNKLLLVSRAFFRILSFLQRLMEKLCIGRNAESSKRCVAFKIIEILVTSGVNFFWDKRFQQVIHLE